MADKRTPTRLGDRTNLPSSAVPSSSSASLRKPSPATYRQPTLADSFLRSSSPAQCPPTTPATAPALSSPLFASTRDSGALTSSAATSPTRATDGDGDVCMGDRDAGESETRRGKRRRVETDEQGGEEDEWGGDVGLVAQFWPGKGKERMQPTLSVAGRQMSVFEATRRRELGFRAGRQQVSMRPWLRTIVSSNEADVTRLPSGRPNRNFAPPFALAFTHGAKAGGKKVVAVADEEGMVSFLSADKDRWTRGPTRHSFQAHENAVFDLSWRDDDELLATASGDQTARLFDVRTQTCVGILSGHTCTVKSVTWDPHNPNLLSTASRDGSIRIWDRRVQHKYGAGADSELGIASVNHIKNAHGPGKGKTTKSRSTTRSVTSVAYLKHQDNLLVSSGSADSIVKVWDLRRSHSRRVNPATLETNEDALLNLDSARPHGIASMTLAPDGRKLYALSTDSQIYAFDPLNLTLPTPLTTFSSPHAHYSSFYVRCAVSPCSRYLASGSSDGGVLLWDTEGSGKDAVRVVGHEREVSGLDWAADSLTTCSDDMLVRCWRPDHTVARLRANQHVRPEEKYDAVRTRERWSGEVPGTGATEAS
ncbi:hypothetical protein JCM10207_006015 [Rhodosporidiobolus poonsookiae]